MSLPIVNVATVHYLSDRWIDLQLHYLTRHVEDPCRVWTCLEGVAPEFAARFHFASDSPRGPHAQKLNFLAERILGSAGDDEVIVFLDGDAFPTAPLSQPLKEILTKYPLVAIRRDENFGETYPSAAFCATTVGFWRSIAGDWRKGPPTPMHGPAPGGRLLLALERAQIEWLPLLRYNAVGRASHPVLFGVYGTDPWGPLIYHHGAGFREPFTRWDQDKLPTWPNGQQPTRRSVAGVLHQYRRSKWKRVRERVIRANERLSQAQFEAIDGTDDFWARRGHRPRGRRMLLP